MLFIFCAVLLDTPLEPILEASWGCLGVLFWLKQGRLGGPRRPKTVFDYFFSALEFPKIHRYYFFGPPEPLQGPLKSPPKASGDPFWPPRGPRSHPEAENDPQMDPTRHKI